MILALWSMARPFILLSVILVYILGTVVAWARDDLFDPLIFGAGLVVLLLVSASIHYVNEYADVETDALTQPTLFSGGSDLTKRDGVPRALPLVAAWVTLIAGLLLSVVLHLLDVLPWVSFPLLVVGAVGGWMYSLPPLKLAWNGWGELDNAVLGAILLPVYAYVLQTGRIDWVVVLGFVPFALVDFLNLLATTWADREADAQVGKHTLAILWPVGRLRRLYLALAVTTFALVIAFAGTVLPVSVALACLLVVPFVVWGAARYTRTDNPMASVTAMVVFNFVLLVGWFQVGVA